MYRMRKGYLSGARKGTTSNKDHPRASRIDFERPNREKENVKYIILINYYIMQQQKWTLNLCVVVCY